MATTADQTYVTRVSVAREHPPVRVATMEATGDRITFGMPTWQSAFYKMPEDGPQAAHPGTWDYLLASVASCLTGTLGTALTARGIQSDGDRLTSTAEADIEVDDGILVMKRIRVQYRLKGAPDDKRAAAERAHAVHARGCGLARTLEGAVEITTAIEFL